MAWLLNHIPYQIERRRSPVLPGLNSDIVLSLSWILITFVGHVSFYAVFSVVAFGNLNGWGEVRACV